MAVYDTLPSNDLKFQDIRDTLNASNGIVNNNVDSAFKETANINMWSKYKPVDFNKNFDLSESELRSIHYGLNIPNKAEADKVFTPAYWSYTLPKGGQNSPYRLGDFRGYFKNAKINFRTQIPDEVLTNGKLQSNYKFTCNFYWRENEANGTLGLRDLFDTSGTSDTYLTMFIAKEGDKYYDIAYSENPLSYYTTRQLSPIPVSIDIGSSSLYDAVTGDKVNVCILMMSKGSLGTTYSLDIKEYPAVKQISIKQVPWYYKISYKEVANFSRTINNDKYDNLSLLDVSVTVTLPSDIPLTDIAIKFKARVIGGSTGESTQYVTKEIFISKSEFESNNRTVTKNATTLGRVFQVDKNNIARIYLSCIAFNAALADNETQWNQYGVSLGSNYYEIKSL